METFGLTWKCIWFSHLFSLYMKDIEIVFGIILFRFFPRFPAFGLNTERYSVSLRIQSECGKIRTSKTPYLDTFHAVDNLLCFDPGWYKAIEESPLKTCRGVSRNPLSRPIHSAVSCTSPHQVIDFFHRKISEPWVTLWTDLLTTTQLQKGQS